MQDSESSSGTPDGTLKSHWTHLRRAIRENVQPEQFEAWFRRAALCGIGESTVRLAVQNTFACNWLKSHYQDVLERAALETLGSPHKVEIEVDPELTAAMNADIDPIPLTDPAPPENGNLNGPQGANGRPKLNGLLSTSDIGLNSKYTFDNFVVGPCNRFAHAAALGVAESPGKAYNPFFLHGSVGLGKTHLLQSACSLLLERDESVRILYLSCETFVNHFISALENGDLTEFRNKYRNVDVLVVDDIHVLANKERTQEEFFHTFNTLYNANKQIVLSSDSPPKDIPALQERLVSRFKWGLVTEIEPPCYETRMAILKRKSRVRGREIPDDVARLLAEHIDTNIRELEGAVTKLIGYASVSVQPITTQLAREVLTDVFEQRRGQPAMEDILRLVTEHYGVKLTELQSRKRTSAIAYPRQIAMFLARRITRHSLEEIGGYFGGRDHSTVLYAIQKIQKQAKADAECKQALLTLLGQLQSPSGPPVTLD